MSHGGMIPVKWTAPEVNIRTISMTIELLCTELCQITVAP